MDTPSPIESLDDLRLTAEHGNPLAQYDLAIKYAGGRGVAQDFTQAVHWFRKAAEQGDAPSQYELGICFKNGRGVPKDEAEAAKWFRKGAELGETSAQLLLSIAYKNGEGVEKNQEESLNWLRRAAEAGDVTAQYLMGSEFFVGRRMPRDYVEAAKWTRKAAEAGKARAQSFYGNHLLFGWGIEKNISEAIKWYQKAAEQGDKRGEYYLGMCYSRGVGLEKNFEEAQKWLQRAAQKNYRDAKYQLRLLLFRKYSILKWRNITLTIFGFALLIFHAFHSPISIHIRAVGIFLGIFAVIALTTVAMAVLQRKFGVKWLDEKDAEQTSEKIISGFKKRPWEFLLIPAEDGFFLLPLLYIGINPLSAAVAAFCFGVMHYPLYPWQACVPKGIAYFFVALFVLPYGIWSVIVAHLSVDAILILALLLDKVEGKPTLRRIVKVLQTE